MDPFLDRWAAAAGTGLGLFWTAFWAFGLGYLISSMIQVFVTRQRMRAALGAPGFRSVALETLFGFVSSSCSFAALVSTRASFTPDPATTRTVVHRTFFALDHTAGLNAVFAALSLFFVRRARATGTGHGHGHGGFFAEPVLITVTGLALAWLAGGVVLAAAGPGPGAGPA